ncbi:MAG: helix-turn-helix domain-containing protein [Pirellulales bacterium]
MTSCPATLESIAARLDDLLARAGEPAPRFVGVEEAARYASLSPESIRRLLSSGALTPLRPVRGRVLVDRAELEQFVLTSTGSIRRGRGHRLNGEHEA